MLGRKAETFNGEASYEIPGKHIANEMTTVLNNFREMKNLISLILVEFGLKVTMPLTCWPEIKFIP